MDFLAINMEKQEKGLKDGSAPNVRRFLQMQLIVQQSTFINLFNGCEVVKHKMKCL